MAQFQPQKIDLAQINSGQRYGNEGISPEAINRPIEASAYAQELSEKANAKSDQALQFTGAVGGVLPSLSAYPIGSIYIANSYAVSPAELFGGTWQIKQIRKTSTVSGTIVANITDNSSPYRLFTLAEIRALFVQYYGESVGNMFQPALCSAVAVNGDTIAQHTTIDVFGWDTEGNFYVDVSRAILGPLRINYSFSFDHIDQDIAYWERLA